MAIIAAYAMPHPPLAIPGVGRGQEKEIANTLAAFDEAAREIASCAPETIVYITPHNVIYADYFHISPGTSARGDFSQFRDGKTQLATEYDVELALEIEQLAEASGIPAGGLGERDKKLDHGVMVPMWFIDRAFAGGGGGGGGGYIGREAVGAGEAAKPGGNAESPLNPRSVRVSQSGMAPTDHYKIGQILVEAAENTGRRTILIASSDMSHKLKSDGPYGYVPEGPEFDEKFAKCLDDGDFLELMKIPASLRERAAECGYNSLMVLAGCFDKRKVSSRLLSYEGPYGVGYAIASFKPGEHDESRDFLDQFERYSREETAKSRDGEDEYRALARSSLEHTIMNGGELAVPKGLSGELLKNRAGVFVSLYKNGRLRGCIGTIAPTTKSVAHEIIQNAISAGLKDTRFDPVTADELPHLVYKVDVLSEAEPIDGPEALDVRRYGVIVSSGYRRGLLLPNLDGVDTVEEQISIARQKAGISEGTPIKLERFEVVRHE
ncbi:MAG: AmmeMemoRadiSam system protein A [Oscillospiraceae bacterium]|nr:AmmeMemoRadiSam system protein A [Oscillospiraceae bacterium]